MPQVVKEYVERRGPLVQDFRGFETWRGVFLVFESDLVRCIGPVYALWVLTSSTTEQMTD